MDQGLPLLVEWRMPFCCFFLRQINEGLSDTPNDKLEYSLKQVLLGAV